MHSEPEQLLRALPAEVCTFVECTTAALIYQPDGGLSFYVDAGQGALPSADHTVLRWPQEIWSAISEREKVLVIPSLDEDFFFWACSATCRMPAMLDRSPTTTPGRGQGRTCVLGPGRTAGMQRDRVSVVGQQPGRHQSQALSGAGDEHA